MKLQNTVPVIATSDIQGTIEYFTKVLGFRKQFVFGNPPVYAGIERDGVLLYASHDPAMATMLRSSKVHPEIFLWVQDVDRLYAEHVKQGANIIEPISDRVWDARQYVIEDPNGYHLKIAEPIHAMAH